ncbi:MAG: hypothetical protein EXQ74_03945 [Thermoleophilia bacterium]|nr:hypothetical protein [Thermoleophilia bacterium]
MPGTTGLGPEADQFIIDATALSAALSGISSALLTLDTPSEGPVVVGSVTNYLEIFDTAIETMQGYEIPDEQWEAQREAMVAGGPALSSAIRQFTDDVQQAADSNSTTQLSSATAALTSAIVAFGTFG